MVCNLLTQIFVVAERKRASKSVVQDAISLIELIQASYSVFERYGIGPPDDAVYHRYLLSLSINPERDWRKKIFNFDLGAQPRVKRLCSAAGHQHGVTKGEAESNSFEESQRRHRTGTKHSHTRQASALVTPMATPRKVHENQVQHDRFGDMLSLESPIQRIHVGDKSRRRTFTPSPGEKVAPMPELAINDEQSKTDEASLGSTGKERRDRIAAGERQLQMITTSIEQWRATQAVKQLVDRNKLQDRKTRQQQVTIPLCIHALFHWITLCLPEKVDFQAMESPRALPLCILRRVSVDLKVFKYSAKRFWMWQMRNLLQQWRRDARAVKTFRSAFDERVVESTACECFAKPDNKNEDEVVGIGVEKTTTVSSD
ncbi:hypothetical protein PF002_g13333 [Phytophthora fragariae]|uniref:Uncharacterized protein n=1 Tax=Phytophthora fragariae TaxID=53985 RepID=A0A6A3KT85_9STRA|nr:hypothetical protein PF003_g36193 [Phytophthora fragariae]KAE9008485.1 hypothetical protein PF011_g10695 [Phytophthora fragariae]KAE9106847.1 hypothetical protein PF007_g13256 [Phytophthora fragariae]KAE9152965.1 hypothetical protein PF006_g2878 [Phytophthora fragariae]KAE9229321.1 hypothetical protein PF002_g13333 [Phytophthora fragariae]